MEQILATVHARPIWKNSFYADSALASPSPLVTLSAGAYLTELEARVTTEGAAGNVRAETWI